MGRKAAPLVYPIGIWASLLGIVQGVTWTAFGIFALLCYYDVYEYEVSTTSHYETLTSFIYYMYLEDNEIYAVRSEDAIVKPEVLAIFSWIYVFLSFIWFSWSSWQLWASLHQKVKFLKTSFLVWNILTILVALLDLVILSLLAHDYDLYNKLDFNVEDAAVGLSYTLIANGVMMSLAARGYVLWFVNVIFVWVIYKIVASGLEEDSDRQVDRRPINAFEPARKPDQTSPATTDPWITNPSAVINEAFDFMGEQQPPPPFDRSQSVSAIENAARGSNSNSNNDGRLKTSSPVGSQKVATVGRKGVAATIAGPYIPEPDYSPPATPSPPPGTRGLRSALKKTEYQKWY